MTECFCGLNRLNDESTLQKDESTLQKDESTLKKAGSAGAAGMVAGCDLR
jgi:hypothetical protein